MESYVLRYNSNVSPGISLQTDHQKPSQSNSDQWFLTCSICNKQFASLLNFRIHTQSHLLKKPYECSHCRRQYHSKFELKDHNCSTGEIPFTCEVCSVSFSTKQKFTEHLRIHYIRKTFQCAKCGEEYSVLGKPKPHACTTQKNTSAAKNFFQCEVCKKQFFSKLNFGIHQRVHADEPVITCQDCHAQIPLRHWQDHACLPFKIRHVCNICFTDCITRINLMHHKFSHKTKRKKFCCYVCNKRYFRKTDLLVHSQKHKRQEDYFCVNCKKRFLFKRIFSNHHCSRANKLGWSPVAQSSSHIFSSPVKNQTFPSLIQKESSSPPVQNQISSPSTQNKNFTALVPLVRRQIHFHPNTKTILVQNQNGSSPTQNQNKSLNPKALNPNKYKKVYARKKMNDRPKPFSCSTCEKNFLSKSGLLNHYKTHSELAMICQYCTKAFTKTEDLNEHLLAIHNGIDKYRCDICEHFFNTKRELHVHYSFHTGKPVYTCEHCKKQFNDKYVLGCHKRLHSKDIVKCSKCHNVFKDQEALKQHNEGELHKCSFCPMSFCWASSLKSHIKFSHSEIKPYNCTFCPEVFSKQSKLVVHLQYHANIKPFGCDICEKKFLHRIALKRHLLTHTVDDQKSYVCDVCQKRFCTHSRLKDHCRSHSGEKPFMCEFCGNLFSQSRNLYMHKKLHYGEKPFKCNLCGKEFALKQLLKSHQSKHTSEKPFKCKFCNKAYKYEVSLRNHQYSHGLEKPFQCKVCGKGFIRKYILNKHMHVQHSPNAKKPFRCEECQKNFTNPHSLRRHVQIHVEES